MSTIITEPITENTVETVVPSPKRDRSPAQKKLDKIVLERVKRGLALLEEEYGEGWEDKIDMANLDLRDGSACVLGQVYHDQACSDRVSNGYYWAVDHLVSIDDGTGSEFGFCVNGDYEPENYDPDGEKEWDLLQETWEYVLSERLR